MKKPEILSIVIKALGLYLLVMAIQALPTIGLAFNGMGQMEGIPAIWYLVVSVIPILLMGVIALYFIIATPSIVKWVDDAEGSDEKSDATKCRTSINKETLQEVIFSGLGVYFVVNSLPRVITLLTHIQGSASGSLIGMIIQMVAGIYLFLCSKQVVVLLKKANDQKVND